MKNQPGFLQESKVFVQSAAGYRKSRLIAQLFFVALILLGGVLPKAASAQEKAASSPGNNKPSMTGAVKAQPTTGEATARAGISGPDKNSKIHAQEQTDAAGEIKAAKALMKNHQYKQAEQLLSRLVKIYPDNLELAMARGELLKDLGQFDQASDEFSRAAQIAPSDPYPLISLAQLSLKKVELEQSMRYAQQAVAHAPDCLAAHLTLIDTLLQCDQTAEAERQLKSLPSNSRGKPEVEQLAYKLSLKKGDLVGAHVHLKQAIEASAKGNLQLHLEQSELLQTMGDRNSARKELESIISADPDLLSPRLKLARLLETQYHDFDAALKNYDEALRIDPLSAQAIAGHDRCLLKRRNIALQLKMALKEFWAWLDEESKNSPPAPERLPN